MTTATQNGLENFKREKVDVDILKIEAGESFVGKLLSVSDRPWMDLKAEGGPKEKMITQYNFVHPTTGARFAYFGDGGFKNAMNTAGIVVGNIVEVIKGEKENLGGGRTVNSYELYLLTPAQ